MYQGTQAALAHSELTAEWSGCCLSTPPLPHLSQYHSYTRPQTGQPSK